jgi:hypothetical protein
MVRSYVAPRANASIVDCGPRNHFPTTRRTNGGQSRKGRQASATSRRLVAFYVHEYNHVLPHSAFRGQTPDERYFGTGRTVAADLTARAVAARRARVAANRASVSDLIAVAPRTRAKRSRMFVKTATTFGSNSRTDEKRSRAHRARFALP